MSHIVFRYDSQTSYFRRYEISCATYGDRVRRREKKNWSSAPLIVPLNIPLAEDGLLINLSQVEGELICNEIHAIISVTAELCCMMNP